MLGGSPADFDCLYDKAPICFGNSACKKKRININMSRTAECNMGMVFLFSLSLMLLCRVFWAKCARALGMLCWFRCVWLLVYPMRGVNILAYK